MQNLQPPDLSPLGTRLSSESSRKMKRMIAIGVVVWVFMMFLFLAFAIIVDWH